MIVALKIDTPNSETAASTSSSSEENKENIRQTSASSVDVVDNGNDAKASEVPMEVEGSVDNNKVEDQQPNTSSATGSGGQGGCPEVEMVSDVDCSISEND